MTNKRNIIAAAIIFIAVAVVAFAIFGCNPPADNPDPPASPEQTYEPDWEPIAAPTDDEPVIELPE